jgi:hypothetical protein
LNLTEPGESVVGFGSDQGPATVQSGVALITNPSTLNIKGELLDLAAVTLTDPNAQIQLTGSTVNQTGTTAPLIRLDPHGGAITMAGPMARIINSTVNSSGAFILGENGSLTSNTTDPFFFVDPSSVTSAQNFALFRNNFALSLKGPLLSLVNSGLTTTGDTVGVLNGAKLESTIASALIQINNSTLNAGTETNFGAVLNVYGTGGVEGTQFASVNLKGGLLSVASTLNTSGGLVSLGFAPAGPVGGGELIVTDSIDPLVTINGGVHTVATLGGVSIFQITGRPTATADEVADGVNLNLGTDKPLQISGPALETTGATITTGATGTTQRGFRIDTALFEASAPLFNLKANSNLTLNNSAVDLSYKAKVTSLGQALIKLDASRLTVKNGAAVNVAGGSYVVTLDLFHLNNGSNLFVLNGPALNVTGNSVAQIGTFIRFSNTNGNTNLSNVTVTNTIAPTPGIFLAGFPVSVPAGATLTVTNPTPIVGLGTSGNVTVTPGGSLLAVAPGSSVRIGP